MALVGAAPACAAFDPNSFVNKPLAPDAPLDPASAAMVNRLQSQVSQYGPWVNTHSFSTPVYTAQAGDPVVDVTANPFDPGLAPLFKNVPLPSTAEPSPDNEGNLVLYQQSSDTLWEFYQLRHDTSGNWEASFGGKMTNVSTNPGYFLDARGAAATGIALLGSLQQIAELQSGVINHAVAFGMPKPAPCYRWPAQRQDGDALSRSDPLAPPEGSILRLPASLNIDALNLPNYTKMVAKAVQKYGMVLRDRSGAVVFYAEEPRPTTAPDPYSGTGGIFGGSSPSSLLSRFPWDKLQVLATPSGKSSCQGLGG